MGNIKPKVSRKEKITIRVEINEIENSRAIRKANETKSWFLGEGDSIKLINLQED